MQTPSPRSVPLGHTQQRGLLPCRMFLRKSRGESKAGRLIFFYWHDTCNITKATKVSTLWTLGRWAERIYVRCCIHLVSRCNELEMLFFFFTISLTSCDKKTKIPPTYILQQKVSVLISDWLPAVINKSTDARKLAWAWQKQSLIKNNRDFFFVSGGRCFSGQPNSVTFFSGLSSSVVEATDRIKLDSPKFFTFKILGRLCSLITKVPRMERPTARI